MPRSLPPKARNGTVSRTDGSSSFWREATVIWIGLLRSEELRGLQGCWRGWKGRKNLEASRLAEHCGRSLGTSQTGERLARITEPEHGQQADDDDLPENREAVNEERQSTAEKRSFGQVEPIHNYFLPCELGLRGLRAQWLAHPGFVPRRGSVANTRLLRNFEFV
jgi:hypothetical protein